MKWVNEISHYSENVACDFYCVKTVQIRSYFGSVFSCIPTEYRKIRTRNNSVYLDTFHAVVTAIWYFLISFEIVLKFKAFLKIKQTRDKNFSFGISTLRWLTEINKNHPNKKTTLDYKLSFAFVLP